MAFAASRPWIRLLPSLTDVAFLMPAVFVCFRAEGLRSLLSDGDTGWHIRAGEWMLRNRRVPETDIFSFTRPGEPWFAWEWLWDVVFGWLHQNGGLAPVALASLVVLCLTSALLFRLVARACGNPLVAILLTVMAAAGSSIHWLARPHLFTLLFVVLFCHVLDRVREGRTRLLLLLPPLTVLWTNLHGGFFVGVLLIAVFAAGELAAAMVATEISARRRALLQSKPYALAAAACAVASLANPYGFRLHLHIFHYLADPYHFDTISEFLSISFHHPAAWYFEVALALGAAAAWWSLCRSDFAAAFLVFGWGHLALISARNIPIFLILMAPPAGRALAAWLDALSKAPVADWLQDLARDLQSIGADLRAIERVGRLHVASALAMLVLLALSRSPAAPTRLRAEFDAKAYPERAVDLVLGTGEAKRIFTNDEWGDYLIYRLFPRTRVYIDGRSDFYGKEFGEQFLSILNGRHGWQEKLSRHGVDTVLLPVNVPLSAALKESSRWRPVYDDGVAIVFRPRT